MKKILSYRLLAFFLLFSFSTAFLSCSKDDKKEKKEDEAIITPVEELGLGKNLQSEVSNNVPYEWYIDQGRTGPHSSVNCGPSSATMAIKWVDETFTKTTEDARNAMRPEGGWCYTSDLIKYMNDNQIDSYLIQLKHINNINQALDKGDVVILCLDMYYIRREQQPAYHVDRFYAANSPDWGHFLVVKGYKVVDNVRFYEVYDPYSFGISYSDGTIKGKDRYYREADLDKATQVWWAYAIAVPRKNENVSRTGYRNENPDWIDPDKINHNYGGIIVANSNN